MKENNKIKENMIGNSFNSNLSDMASIKSYFKFCQNLTKIDVMKNSHIK
jgi:hypothetical protein